MSDVGVRELKQHLSEYLERASQGETIRVTDRGRPKAILAPIPGRLQIEKGIAEGWITPATRSGFEPFERIKPMMSTEEALAEDRDE